MQYLYLHGFASSPRSGKAQYFRDRFEELGQSLLIPDLNQGDFFHLTLSRQIAQVAALLSPGEPVTIIGSSFGGLTAAWLAEKHPQVVQLFLLAPAFEFASHWLPRLGNQYHRWQETGVLEVYHHTEERLLPLSYDFAKDLLAYDDRQLQRPVPTLIFHGLQDEVIPIEASRRYCEGRPWVSRVELDSDHALKEVQPAIWGMMLPLICKQLA
ncbi:YqiA/YcfP family alpha/beta fold hydrolase [uncultured Thermosynechococcus sp.]|uniref:YqiA/YcfP family alpha/beta fold hydrolase n=1 Tax=uncultured Thermosynechococcus sp. TaxID=436945 RepID=UPI002607EF8F|nr:YqiA/YcfP family alpha/beta fold hydrolase [uncultured Thermosynechococcus sp.]